MTLAVTMFSKFSHLLITLGLFAVAAFFISRTTQGWQVLWQRHSQEAVPSDGSSSDSSDSDIVLIDGTRIHGILKGSPSANPGQPGNTAPSVPRHGDRVDRTPASAPRRLLHGRFAVKTYRHFEFFVPAHSLRPRLTGTYEAASGPAEVLLFKDDEFGAFLRDDADGQGLAAGPSNSGQIGWSLTPTDTAAQKYHLIIRNSSGSSGVAYLSADFTLSFE